MNKISMARVFFWASRFALVCHYCTVFCAPFRCATGRNNQHNIRNSVPSWDFNVKADCTALWGTTTVGLL